eukprot:c17544_g1_i1.p1 GENE.c17544_g1_i1~~c17544_g1_i1.p1  ORF type:complete len:860 (+),score=158.11 c17544_g1_i1:385-2580(+)
MAQTANAGASSSGHSANAPTNATTTGAPIGANNTDADHPSNPPSPLISESSDRAEDIHVAFCNLEWVCIRRLGPKAQLWVMAVDDNVPSGPLQPKSKMRTVWGPWSLLEQRRQSTNAAALHKALKRYKQCIWLSGRLDTVRGLKSIVEYSPTDAMTRVRFSLSGAEDVGYARIDHMDHLVHILCLTKTAVQSFFVSPPPLDEFDRPVLAWGCQYATLHQRNGAPSNHHHAGAPGSANNAHSISATPTPSIISNKITLAPHHRRVFFWKPTAATTVASTSNHDFSAVSPLGSIALHAFPEAEAVTENPANKSNECAEVLAPAELYSGTFDPRGVAFQLGTRAGDVAVESFACNPLGIDWMPFSMRAPKRFAGALTYCPVYPRTLDGEGVPDSLSTTDRSNRGDDEPSRQQQQQIQNTPFASLCGVGPGLRMFRCVLRVETEAELATLCKWLKATIIIRDAGAAWFNGICVGGGRDPGQQVSLVCDLEPYVIMGANVLTVAASSEEVDTTVLPALAPQGLVSANFAPAWICSRMHWDVARVDPARAFGGDGDLGGYDLDAPPLPHVSQGARVSLSNARAKLALLTAEDSDMGITPNSESGRCIWSMACIWDSSDCLVTHTISFPIRFSVGGAPSNHGVHLGLHLALSGAAELWAILNGHQLGVHRGGPNSGETVLIVPECWLAWEGATSDATRNVLELRGYSWLGGLVRAELRPVYDAGEHLCYTQTFSVNLG